VQNNNIHMQAQACEIAMVDYVTWKTFLIH